MTSSGSATPRARRHIAVIGAGPVGLAFALAAARLVPADTITVFDSRPADADLHADPRALALSAGSIQMLRSLGVWPAAGSQAAVAAASSAGMPHAPIRRIEISQGGPSLSYFLPFLGPPAGPVTICADDEAVSELGAVVRYGTLTSSLQQRWLDHCAARPERGALRLACAVNDVRPTARGVEIDADICETYDVAVFAEGGVFQRHEDGLRRPAASFWRDYGQRALIGEVLLRPAGGQRDAAFEHFTSQGPLALLPLPALDNDPAGLVRMSLVWCLLTEDAQRIEATGTDVQRQLLQAVLPARAGELVSVGALRGFDLGLSVREPRLRWFRTGGRSGLGRGAQIARIGNAAQTLHPVAGQGLNLGLRDAWALAQSMRHHREGADALAAFNAGRGADQLVTVAATDLFARGFVWGGIAPALARALGLSMLVDVRAVRHALAELMMFGVRRQARMGGIRHRWY